MKKLGPGCLIILSIFLGLLIVTIMILIYGVQNYNTRETFFSEPAIY